MALTRSEKTQLGVLKTKQENSDTFGPLTPQEQKTLEELQQKQGDQSGLFSIFTPLQASEVDPNNPPSMLPTGAMDRETPFGDIAPGAYGKMGEDVYTKMDDGSTRVDPYASQKFYDDRIFDDYFSTERQFDQIRGGPESGAFGVRGISRVQDIPVDLGELDYRETSAEEDEEAAALLELAQQEERRGALETLKAFGQDVMSRPIISSILSGTGRIAGGITGLAGLAGPSQSQRTFDAMTPGQQAYTSSLYGRQPDGTPGLLQGYNQISAFGKGAIGTLGDRLTAIQTRKAPQTALSLARQQQITDAINKSINIGESEALKDSKKNVGGIRTDIDVADGGAETSGGKIVCTMMNESYGFGSFRNKIWLRQSKDLAPEYQKGYHILFLPLVKLAKTNKIIRKVLEHIAVHRTIDIRQESRGKTHILGRLYRKVLEPICYWVGKYAKR